MKDRLPVAGLIISFLFSLLSLYQTFRYVLSTPDGYVFPLVHNFEQDYYWYLSLMRQGWEGNLALTSRYSVEIFSPQPVNTFFALLGLIGRITGLNLPVVYTMARVSGGAFLLFSSYLIIRTIFSTSRPRFLAFLFVLAGAPVWFLKNRVLVQSGEFWTGFDPVLRVAWLPHHTLSNALFALLLLLSFNGIKPGKTVREGRMRTGVLFLLSFTAVWLNPATGILIWFAFGGTFLVCILRSRLSLDLIWRGMAALAGSGFALLLLYNVQRSSFPWTAFGDWERFNRYPIGTVGYLLVLGATGFLALPGIYVAVKKSSVLLIGVVLWYVFPFVGLTVLSGLLPVSNGRFLQSASYIPASILAALLVNEAVYHLKRENVRVWAFVGVIVVFLAVSFPSFYASIRRQDLYIERNASNRLVYVPKTTMDGLKVLETGPGGVLIAPRDVSVLAPAFTPYRVVAGHPTFTQSAGQKESDLSAFYGGDTQTRLTHVAEWKPVAIWIPAIESGWEFLAPLGYAETYTAGGAVIYEK